MVSEFKHTVEKWAYNTYSEADFSVLWKVSWAEAAETVTGCRLFRVLA